MVQIHTQEEYHVTVQAEIGWRLHKSIITAYPQKPEDRLGADAPR